MPCIAVFPAPVVFGGRLSQPVVAVAGEPGLARVATGRQVSGIRITDGPATAAADSRGMHVIKLCRCVSCGQHGCLARIREGPEQPAAATLLSPAWLIEGAANPSQLYVIKHETGRYMVLAQGRYRFAWGPRGPSKVLLVSHKRSVAGLHRDDRGEIVRYSILSIFSRYVGCGSRSQRASHAGLPAWSITGEAPPHGRSVKTG